MWSVIRHGTRTPKTKSIKLMRERLTHLRDLIIDNMENEEGKNYYITFSMKW